MSVQVIVRDGMCGMDGLLLLFRRVEKLVVQLMVWRELGGVLANADGEQLLQPFEPVATEVAVREKRTADYHQNVALFCLHFG